MSIRDKWVSLDPKYKRYAVIGMAGLVVVAVMSFTTRPQEEKRPASRQELIRHVLTDQDTRNAGLDALAADLKNLRSDSTKTTRALERIEREVEVAKRQSNEVPAPLRSRMERMSQDIETMMEKLGEMQKSQQVQTVAPDEARVGADTQSREDESNDEQGPSPFGGRHSGITELDPSNPLAVFQKQRWSTTTLPEKIRAPGNDEASSTMTMMTIVEELPEPEDEGTGGEDHVYLPAGAIITGTLINGMDAPTGNGAQRDPFPSLLRIQKEAILPNRFRADIRECFLIIGGYGDLSSERAYLRGETLSCVRDDSGVIETRLDSYAVGEDGKAGVRGRLVSKQGQIIAKSLMAGFLSGVSKAFDVKPVPIIDTSGNAGMARNKANSNWLQSSAVSGASTALDRIAEFYLDMAEGMFPVIEVDAGRQIDVIVNRGTRLEVRGTGVGKGGK
ncbi:TrbI/VirB10 family protein [Alcaligenes faecalis]|uniref:TrbI/VirB10 family protein n=1 Tax=Alcaligenes faecalis TaxID=511 RepID=UPI001C0B6C06|nr:TrbI/VirB10 family protein [Alcaligenes faecalis]